LIRLHWAERLAPSEVDQVTELIEYAAAYDKEAEFSTPTAPPAAEGYVMDRHRPGRTYHLLVMPEPGNLLGAGLTPRALIAYLRAEVRDQCASAEYVVHPDARSLGVTTLLMERLALPGPDGWGRVDADRVYITAQGDHPAAARAADRFGARETHRMWMLVRHLDSGKPPTADLDDDGSDDPGLEVIPLEGAAGLAIGGFAVRDAAGGELLVYLVPHSEGLTGSISAGEPSAKASRLEVLLRRALGEVAAHGAVRATMQLPPEDRTRVAIARRLYFEHERSDVTYCLPLARW
jgi:hypothetical protein